MMLTALIIFLLTYVVIGVQKIPRIHISRASGALLGAVAMPLLGVLTPQEAYAAIDMNTIVFLLGMMIIVAYLEISGFFEYLKVGLPLTLLTIGLGVLVLYALAASNTVLY